VEGEGKGQLFDQALSSAVFSALNMFLVDFFGLFHIFASVDTTPGAQQNLQYWTIDRWLTMTTAKHPLSYITVFLFLPFFAFICSFLPTPSNARVSQMHPIFTNSKVGVLHILLSPALPIFLLAEVPTIE
jgi:hypothetical protein